MGVLIKQSSTGTPLRFLLVSSSDHITGLTGKAASVVVKISKNGAAAVTPSGAISEVDATNEPGVYAIAGNATDTGTLGPIDIYAKDAASDPTNMIDAAQIVAFDPTDATALGLSRIDATISSRLASNLDGNGYQMVDIENIAGAAVSTTTAQFGVNVVKYNNQTAQTDANNLPKVDVEDWNATVVSAPATAGQPVVTIGTNGITDTSYAAGTGKKVIRAGTAQAGGATSITLDAGASATTNYYINCLVYITGGTGIGQARFITAYNGSTKVATVSAWATNPDATSTFAILPFDAIPGATAPTAAQNATAVWTDLLAGSDFSTASSIGALIKTAVPNASPGASGGIPTGDSNGAVKVQAGIGTGQLDVTSGVIKASLVQILGTAFTETSAGYIAAAWKQLLNVATAVATVATQWPDAGTYTNTRGAKLDNLDATISSRSTYAGADTSGTTTLLGRLTATRAGNLDNLDAAVSSRAQPGDAMALTAAERNSTADALLDRSAAVDTFTPRQILRGLAAACLGAGSGFDTGTGTYKSADGSVTRITATLLGSGNRSVTLSL